MNHNLKLLSIYDSKLKQIGDEIALLACGVHQFSSATAIALDVSLRHLTHARKRLYDEVFINAVGSVVTYKPNENIPESGGTHTIIAINPREGLIEYSTGMVDEVHNLLEALLDGSADISDPVPQISLEKNDG